MELNIKDKICLICPFKLKSLVRRGWTCYVGRCTLEKRCPWSCVIQLVISWDETNLKGMMGNLNTNKMKINLHVFSTSMNLWICKWHGPNVVTPKNFFFFLVNTPKNCNVRNEHIKFGWWWLEANKFGHNIS